MTSQGETTAATATRPLAGASCWIITDGKAGHDTQARGVADALGLVCEMKRIAPRGIFRWAAPWGPVDPRERFGRPESPFAPPWPEVAIAVGRLAIPYLRALKRAAGVRTFTIALEDARAGARVADFLWVPEHDPLRGPNVITTLTSPHNFPVSRLAELRQRRVPEIEALPAPRVTVILGGKNAVYKFTDADDARLEAALRSMAELGASFLITPSRRTHARLIRAVESATRNSPRILWDGQGANPYPDFLAHGDVFVVTADSVNMTGEACATGRPVYVFTPSGGSAKFRRFHAALNAYGATRPLPERFDGGIPQWSYAPLDSARTIAQEVERRWQRRSHMLSGLVGPGSGVRRAQAKS